MDRLFRGEGEFLYDLSFIAPLYFYTAIDGNGVEEKCKFTNFFSLITYYFYLPHISCIACDFLCEWVCSNWKNLFGVILDLGFLTEEHLQKCIIILL